MHADTFQLLIDSLESSRSKEEAVSALSRYLATVNIAHYAYLGFGGAGAGGKREPFRAGNYPAAWVEEYMGDRLYAVDPVVLRATRSNLPLTWNGDRVGAADRDPLLQELFDRASAFGIRSGYTIPIRSSIGQLATLTFASELEALPFDGFLSARQAELHLGAFHFHDAIERLSTSAADAILTPRERTCLTFSAQGLSAKEIARILEISPRSVKFHLDNSREKLGASNLKQAISTANSLRAI